MRKQGNASPQSPSCRHAEAAALLPGTAPIAQIRSLPLHISQIRCFERNGLDRSHRSSYIINSSKVSAQYYLHVTSLSHSFGFLQTRMCSWLSIQLLNNSSMENVSQCVCAQVRNTSARVKRSRSLSPEILRETATEPLTSPLLVRSATLTLLKKVYFAEY